MRLEVGTISIRDVRFGTRTELQNHTLVVDPEEIRQLILEDPHFIDAQVDLAKPGEAVRIIHGIDIVEPRWKVSGPGGVFPGFVSSPTTCGEGRTNRLAGVAIIEAHDPVPGEPTHFRERVIDMSGPGAPYSPFSQTLNLVLNFTPNSDFFPPASADIRDFIGGGPEAAEYGWSVMRAGMKVAARLGRASIDIQPDEIEVFELPPCDPTLPKVVCIYQNIHPPFLYGTQLPLPAGALVHPNEYFDGAVTGWRGTSSANSTYWEQNNRAMQKLCRRHGKDINFLGCIPFGYITPERPDKERHSSAIARMAHLLGADGALFLGLNGSNYTIDLMLTLQKCEQLGIKSTLLYYDVGYGPGDPGFIFHVPEADAIVCTGSRDQPVTLPPMPKILGGTRLVAPDMDPTEEITVPMRYLHGAIGVQGYNRLTTRFE